MSFFDEMYKPLAESEKRLKSLTDGLAKSQELDSIFGGIEDLSKDIEEENFDDDSEKMEALDEIAELLEEAKLKLGEYDFYQGDSEEEILAGRLRVLAHRYDYESYDEELSVATVKQMEKTFEKLRELLSS